MAVEPDSRNKGYDIIRDKIKSKLPGAEPNTRPPPKSSSRCCKRTPKLECNGQKNESHLPYIKLLQHGRNKEVSHRRMLGTGSRHPKCTKSSFRRICKSTIKSNSLKNSIKIYFSMNL